MELSWTRLNPARALGDEGPDTAPWCLSSGGRTLCGRIIVLREFSKALSDTPQYRCPRCMAAARKQGLKVL